MDFETIRDQIRRSLTPEAGSLDDPATEALVRERTARLAEAPQESEREVAHEVVVVERAGARLGLPRERVERLRVVRLCRLPRAPPTLPGIFHVRGKVLCALDMHPLLGGVEPVAQGDLRLVAILDHPRGALGLCVDEVLGLRQVRRDELDHGAKLGRSDFFSAMTRDLLAIVDIARLLERPEFSMTRIGS